MLLTISLKAVMLNFICIFLLAVSLMIIKCLKLRRELCTIALGSKVKLMNSATTFRKSKRWKSIQREAGMLSRWKTKWRKCARNSALSRILQTLTRSSNNSVMSSTNKVRRRKRPNARNVPGKQLLRRH